MTEHAGENRAHAKCGTCGGDCYVPAVSERDLLHPDATAFGEPLMLCPDCNGSGEHTLLRVWSTRENL